MTFTNRHYLALLVLLTLCVYYPTFFASFNSLDDLILVERLLNQDSFTLRQHFFPGGTYDYYRPLLTLTFELDRTLGGLHEMFMHSINIFIHLCNVLLVFVLAQTYCPLNEIRTRWIPGLAAALYAVHPINTEAVNWIAGRTDLLAGTFVFIALIALLKALKTRSLWWGALVAVAILGGSLCKETALFVVPGVLLLIWKMPSRNGAWRGRWSILVLVGMAVLSYFLLRWGAYHYDRGLGHSAQLLAQSIDSVMPASAGPKPAVPSFQWLAFGKVVLKVAGFYAVKLFQPLPLNFAIVRVSDLYVVPGVAVIMLMPLLFWRNRPVGRLFLVSAGVAVSALLVVLTRLAWTPLAERYMYIPAGILTVGVAILIAELAAKCRRQQIATLLGALLLFGMTAATAQRNMVWQDNLALYADTVRKSPDFAPAKNELAIALSNHGRKEEAAALIESIRMPGGQLASFNQAALLREEKRYAEAREFLLERLKNPGPYEVRILELLLQVNGAELSQEEGEPTARRERLLESLAWLRRLEALSHDPFILYRQGQINLSLGDRVAARDCFARAAERFPEGSPYKAPAQKLAKDLSP